MNKKMIVIEMIFLFLLSSLTPLVIGGYTIKNTNTVYEDIAISIIIKPPSLKEVLHYKFSPPPEGQQTALYTTTVLITNTGGSTVDIEELKYRFIRWDENGKKEWEGKIGVYTNSWGPPIIEPGEVSIVYKVQYTYPGFLNHKVWVGDLDFSNTNIQDSDPTNNQDEAYFTHATLKSKAITFPHPILNKLLQFLT